MGGIRQFMDYFREEVEGRIQGKDPDDPEVEDYVHAVLAGAESCSLDKQGRVRLPSRLRDDAEIDRECIVISLLNRIEIWQPEAWSKRRSEARDSRRRRRGT